MKLKKLNRLVSSLTIESILATNKVSSERVVDGLDKLEFVTRSISMDGKSVSIVLQIIDDLSFSLLMSGEANKFILASRISYHRSMQVQENNSSWQAIEQYYSAYFAIHYLIRVTGLSLTNLDEKAVRLVIKSYLSGSTIPAVPTGLYTMKYNASSKELVLTKDLKKKSGGSHKDAWQLWCQLTDDIKEKTKIDPVEYAQEFAGLLEHRAFLSKSAGTYSAPDLRGKINYQFLGGTWAFEHNANKEVRKHQLTLSGTDFFSTSCSPTIENLLVNNFLIIELARSVFQNSVDKYPRGINRSLFNKYISYFQ